MRGARHDDRRAPVYAARPAPEVVRDDDRTEHVARRAAQVRSAPPPPLIPARCLCCASGMPCATHDAEPRRPRGEPLPADVRGDMEARLGAPLGGVRVDTSAEAAAEAARRGARAFTVGPDIAFARGQLVPSTPAGRELLLHELVHAVHHADGRLRRVADPAGARELVSTSSETDALVIGFTASQWFDVHGPRVVGELAAMLEQTPLALPIPELSWRGSQAGFVRALTGLFGRDAGTAWWSLSLYLRPDSLAEAVDMGRDVFPHPRGAPEWKAGVVDEVARRLTSRLIDALPRVGPRFARYQARNALPPGAPPAPSPPPSGGAEPAVTLRLSATTPVLVLPLEPQRITQGLSFTHPLDPLVFTALIDHADVDTTAYRAAHPDEFTAEARAADERPLRPVQLRFLASEGMPSWIRVTSPVDATVEEVANELFGEPTAAYKLTAVPPLFGLPPAEIPQARLFDRAGPLVGTAAHSEAEDSTLRWEYLLAMQGALAAAHVDADALRAGRGPELELLTHPPAAGGAQLVDDLARRAAARIMPTPGADKALVVDRLALIYNALSAMRRPAGELVRPPTAADITLIYDERTRRVWTEPYVAAETRDILGRLDAARGRIYQRHQRLTAADEATAVTWDPQTHGQLEIVTTAAAGIQTAAALAAGYRGWPDIYELIRGIADAYVTAAEISDLYGPARARLDQAERRSVMFPITAMELWLARLRAAFDEARTGEITVRPDTAAEARQIAEMDRQEQALRDRLARVRGQILTDPRAAQTALRRILADLRHLQTGASLALNLDTVDRVWQTLYDRISALGELRGLFGGEGNEPLTREMHVALRIRSEWDAILRVWRRGDRDEARRQLEDKARPGGEWARWLNRVAEVIRDHQTYDQITLFAAMVGIAILSAGIGAYVEVAVGAAWGVGAGAGAWASVGAAGAGVLAEASVFTALSYPLTARDPSLGDFASQLGLNLAFIGGGRLLAAGFQGLIGPAAARTLGGRAATAGVVGLGFTGANLALANERMLRERGRGLSPGEAGAISLENAAFLGVTALAQALLRRPLANLRLEGELAGMSFRHTRSLRALDATLGELRLTTSPDAGLRARVTEATARAFASEQALQARLRGIVDGAEAMVEQQPGERGQRARARELRRWGISEELAARLRSPEFQSDVVNRIEAMQAIRITQALEPIGRDFAIRGSENFEAALRHFSRMPGTLVIRSDLPRIADLEPPGPRARRPAGEPEAPALPVELGGRFFEVRPPGGEAPFRVYERPAAASGEVAGRVELAPTAEAAAAAREPMARPSSTGGRAGASELDWNMPMEAIAGVRLTLLRPSAPDVGRVAASMRDAGQPVSREAIQAVKRYLFDTEGISFDRANYEAWRRLATGRAQVRDVAFIVHELAEIRVLEGIRARTGFDYRGTDFENMTRQQQQRWRADFDRYYLQAHVDALGAEYRFVSQAISTATGGRVRMSYAEIAAIDPVRGEARAYMQHEGRPLTEHPSYRTWTARAGETVEIGAGTQASLRLPTRTPTRAELVRALKYGAGGPAAEATGVAGFVGPARLPAGGLRTGATGGEPAWTPPRYWNGPSAHGRWLGARGDSGWVDERPEVIRIVGRGASGEANPVPFRQGVVDFSAWSQGELMVPVLTGEHPHDMILIRLAIADLFNLAPGASRSARATAARLYLNSAPDGFGGTGLRPHHAGGERIQLIPRDVHRVQHTDLAVYPGGE